jgi:hypothetical protein
LDFHLGLMINDFIIIDALFFSLFYGYKARSIVVEMPFLTPPVTFIFTRLLWLHTRRSSPQPLREVLRLQ